MKAVKTISLVNPRILEVVSGHKANGVGRSYTETAENLILEGDHAVKAKRAEAERQPAPVAPS